MHNASAFEADSIEMKRSESSKLVYYSMLDLRTTAMHRYEPQSLFQLINSLYSGS